jgi:septal ring factor EnvC (AmiA/AmiB activator)
LFRLRNYFTSTLRQEMLEEFTKLQKIQYQQHQQIVLEFQRLANSAKIQTRLSQKIFSGQHSLESLQQQLDRIEQKCPGADRQAAVDSLQDDATAAPRQARGEGA